MPIVWPASLPAPRIGWSERKLSNTVRTETDAGPAKVRRRYTKAVRQLELEYAMTAAQVVTLDAFHTSTLADGVERFEMAHPRTGVTHEFRFVEPFQTTGLARGLYAVRVVLDYLA